MIEEETRRYFEHFWGDSGEADLHKTFNEVTVLTSTCCLQVKLLSYIFCFFCFFSPCQRSHFLSREEKFGSRWTSSPSCTGSWTSRSTRFPSFSPPSLFPTSSTATAHASALMLFSKRSLPSAESSLRKSLRTSLISLPLS